MSETLNLIDFFYADHERVAALLAQMTGEGSPTKSESSGTKSKTEKIGAKLDLRLISGSGSNEVEWAKEVRKTYDPLWINSRTLIDRFDSTLNSENKLNTGQIRTLCGTLLAYDLSTVSALMNSPAIEPFIKDGSNIKNKYEAKNNASLIREFLKQLPLGIGFVLVTAIGHLWFTVKKDYLSLYNLDIPLKYPVHVSGQWNVLGIVDAMPNDHIEGIQPVIDRQIDGLLPAMVWHMMELTGTMTGMFGRPVNAYGISPLVIYRKIEAV